MHRLRAFGAERMQFVGKQGFEATWTGRKESFGHCGLRAGKGRIVPPATVLPGRTRHVRPCKHDMSKKYAF